MRGGRSFSSRGSGHTRGGRGGSYRGNNSSSYRDRSSSRYETPHNGRSSYGGGGGGGGGNNSHYNSSSSISGGRNRYPSSSRSSHETKRPYNNSYSRDRESPVHKRSRHEGGGGSRRDFSSSSERGRFDNHHHHSSGSSSHRSKMRSPPIASSRSPFRGGRTSNLQREKVNMGPPTRLPPRKFASSVRSRPPPPARVGRRSRIVPARATARATIVRRRRDQDNARRAKIANLRSSIKKRIVGDKVSKASVAAEADEDDESDKKTDENGDKSADESVAQKKKTSLKSRPKNGDKAEGDDVDLDETAVEGENDEEAEEDIEHGSGNEENGDEEKGNRKKGGLKKDISGREESSRSRKNYIKLNCMHCKKHCVTFQEYNNHLHSRQHRLALRRISVDQKAKILKMRFVQRQAQREVDGDTKASTAETSFCTLCRLNYRSPKTEHQASEEHREMKKFLMPYCDICHIGFKSPMDYEVHRCSLEHIKVAHRKGVSPKKKIEVDDEDELQVDLGEFTTVDSVGDIDYIPLNDLDEDEDEEKADNGTPKANVLVGSEHVKKVEAFYCDICHYFLPKHKDPEQALKKHCNVRTHLRNYLRFKEDETLRLAAEKVHRRHQEETNTNKDDKEAEKTEAIVNEEEGGETWDKDSSDILPPALNTNEDEDEDSTTTTERYDRFKNSGKSNDSDAEKIDESIEEIKKAEIIDEIKE